MDGRVVRRWQQPRRYYYRQCQRVVADGTCKFPGVAGYRESGISGERLSRGEEEMCSCARELESKESQLYAIPVRVPPWLALVRETNDRLVT